MEQSNPQKSNGQKVTEVVGGIRLVTQDYVVKVPVFEDEVVKRPVFQAEEIKVPTGWDRVTNALALEICQNILKQLEPAIISKIDAAIKGRIDTIKVPKIVEEVKVVYKDVPVERAVITDVPVERAIFKDKTIINPVTKDVEVVNALIIDKPVINAVVQDVKVNNAVITDVDVERAVIREKIVEVTHKQCHCEHGKPLV
jgi:hypothetical protein